MPIPIGLIALGSGLMTAIAGSGTSDREKAIRNTLADFEKYTKLFEDTSFTKEELFNDLLPSIQAGFRGAGDVAAGRAGAALGEQGLAQGGGFKDAYIQAIAPHIAKGEQLAAGAEQNMIDTFAKMDATQKQQLLQFLSAKSNVANMQEDMTGAEKFFTNFLSGAQMGSTVGGNIATSGAMDAKGGYIKKMMDEWVSGKGVSIDSKILDIDAGRARFDANRESGGIY